MSLSTSYLEYHQKNSVLTHPKLSMLQTTLAAASVKPSLQTVPHWPLWRTSSRPSSEFEPPTNLTKIYQNIQAYRL